MVVEEIEVATRQAVDFGESVVHLLRIKTATTLKERVLVAKVAMLGTATRDYDRIGDEVVAATNQVATNGWQAIKGAAARRNVDLLGSACSEITQKLRERLFARA